MEAFIPDYKGVLLAGVDEVGRGPLAGDVVAAAVILDPANPIEGLADCPNPEDSYRNRLVALRNSNSKKRTMLHLRTCKSKKQERPHEPAGA